MIVIKTPTKRPLRAADKIAQSKAVKQAQVQGDPKAPAQDAAPDLLQQYQELEDIHAYRARFDPAAFAAYVMRDEESNLPIKLAPIHFEWNDLASTHRRLLIWSSIESGKSTLLSISRVLWEIGKNPNLRVVVISNTSGQATKILLTIAKYIEKSPEYRKVFPHVKRDDGMPWNQSAIYIERDSRAKDPTVQVCGVHSNILGSRIDLLVIDDILDYEISVSAAQRASLKAWFASTLEGRLTRWARVWCVGTAWNRDDLMHDFAARKDWFAVRYPVLDEDFNPSWPERWSKDRIAEKRIALGPTEFNRQLMCIARSDEEARFKKEWIDRCLERGEGRQRTHALESVPHGYQTFTGVDLSVGGKDSDLSCLFTIIVHPDETREVLDIQAGRWGGPEIVQRIIDTHYRYHSRVIVESNAAQTFILQFTRKMSAVPVIPYNTGKNITHPQYGIEALATEMAASKWVIPSVRKDHVLIGATAEIQAWMTELLYYDPNTHAGDRLMGSWFAREGARQSRPKLVQGRIDTFRR